MKIAIAALVKDEAPRIHELVKSIHQADADFFYLIDDRSTDDTLEIFSNLPKGGIERGPAVIPETDDFGEKKNFIHLLITTFADYDWILHIDADERFDPYFLANMKKIINKSPETLSFAFPRLNLPSGLNYPDYQVRLMRLDPDKEPDIEWRGLIHEKPYSKAANLPLMDAEECMINFKHSHNCIKLNGYPIIHLPRRTDIKRPWW